jgi:hypothetical protein
MICRTIGYLAVEQLPRTARRWLIAGMQFDGGMRRSVWRRSVRTEVLPALVSDNASKIRKSLEWNARMIWSGD